MTKRNAKIVGAVFVVCAALPLAAGLAAGRSEKIWAPWDTPNDASATPGDFQSDQPQIPMATQARPRGLAVCVRLCDGSFFPSAASSGGDEACAAQCPDAPAALYFERAGSDRIEDAVSADGSPYSALPTAGRYRTTLDASCRCRRSPTRDYVSAILTDPTLRKGDIVMTPKGLVVYQGAKAGPKTASDFVSLSQARSLPKDLQTSVSALRVADPAL
jgi:hypothetical protein